MSTTTPNPVEPGYTTTEFFAMVYAEAANLVPAITGHLSWTEASAIGGGIAAIYGVIRSYRKVAA